VFREHDEPLPADAIQAILNMQFRYPSTVAAMFAEGYLDPESNRELFPKFNPHHIF
jgi:hypothetical protein